MFRNEVTWKRTTTHSDSKTWSRVSDTVFFYTKGNKFTWNTQRNPHSEAYIAGKYSKDDGDGRIYRLDNMTSPNPRPNMMYLWKGFPFPERAGVILRKRWQGSTRKAESGIRGERMEISIQQNARNSNATLKKWKAV